MAHLKDLTFKFVLLGALSAAILPGQAFCSTTIDSRSGVSATVDESTGGYSVTEASTGWTFRGSVGAPLSNIKTSSGHNRLGSYKEASFDWQGNIPLRGRIRNYQNRSAVIFSITALKDEVGPLPDFPAFTHFPQNLRILNYRDEHFTPASFKPQETSTPWFLFDDMGETAALSPASDFIVSQMHGDGSALIASGLNTTLKGESAGFTHDSVFVAGQGIVSTARAWGDVLTDISGKKRSSDDADPVTKYLGFWTDNGAYYYYNYDPEKGYCGTLLDVFQKLRDQKVPVRYLQLDSWWYQKSLKMYDGRPSYAMNSKLPAGTWNVYGGTIDYSAHPFLFPNGLEAFHKQIGVDFVVHNRWLDPAGPYHEKYKMSGVAMIDPAWWSDRMAYLKNNGVFCYEQDWLNYIYAYSEMASDPAVGEAFTDGMENASKANGLSLQYCMATPRFFLQGSKYNNLTSIRVSDDRFNPEKYRDFVYTSLLADALKVRPFSDVFYSYERSNLVGAVLSSGPVGFGENIAKLDRASIMRSARQDGVIVRPDTNLVPTDATILSDSKDEHKPLVATASVNDGVLTTYAFCYRRPGDTGSVSFIPESLGYRGQVYVYNIEDRSGLLISAQTPVEKQLDEQGWAAYAIAPVASNGIAFLGDENKIAGMGRARIVSLVEKGNSVIVQVALSAGEDALSLHGYSAQPVSVKASNGNAVLGSYENTTGIFHIDVSPGPNTKKSNSGGDPVSIVTMSINSSK